MVHVHNYLAQLVDPFTTVQQAQQLDLKAIGKKVLEAVAPPPADNSTSGILSLISGIVKLGVVVPGPVSNAAAGLSAALSLLSYLTRDNGAPDLLGPRVTSKADEQIGRAHV